MLLNFSVLNFKSLYRHYCTRRLHRLRKALKMVNSSKGRFMKKTVPLGPITDPRFVNIYFWMYNPIRKFSTSTYMYHCFLLDILSLLTLQTLGAGTCQCWTCVGHGDGTERALAGWCRTERATKVPRSPSTCQGIAKLNV